MENNNKIKISVTNIPNRDIYNIYVGNTHIARVIDIAETDSVKIDAINSDYYFFNTILMRTSAKAAIAKCLIDAIASLSYKSKRDNTDEYDDIINNLNDALGM